MPPPPPPATRPAGGDITTSWAVVDNFKKPGEAFSSELTLTNGGMVALGKSGWTLYFNFVRGIFPETFPAGIKATRINGDFFKLEPTESFVPVEPGQSLVIPFDAEAWAIKETDAPAVF